jgi:hypothetical protein
MRSAIIGALALVLPIVAMAAGAPGARSHHHYSGTMTGDTLVRSYMGPPEARNDVFLKGGDAIARETARGYMDGIKDATEGTVWCFVTGLPHELNEDIVGAIEKLPLEERKGNAGPLVVKVLRQLYPCSRRTP